MSTKMLPICGAALPKHTMILYRPFHDFISRKMRRIRSIRRMRKKERLTPVSASRIVIDISRIESETIVPSS